PERSRATFERVAGDPRVTVLRHPTNRGKGEALKTAFAYVLSTPATVGVVTADADGQHLVSDVRRVAEQLERSPSAFVLGTRTFDRDVPLANRVGNVAARGLFRLLVRRRITDTQTGLRGIPAAFLAELIEVEEVRYDFELEMLVRAVARELSIVELP